MARYHANPFAYYLNGPTPVGLAPLSGPSASARDLPEELTIPPGCYRVHGRVYDLSREGLYRFFAPLKDNQQRIVYNREILSMMSAVCWTHSHGSRDDYKSFEAVAKLALTEKIILTCGPFSDFVKTLFTTLGVRIRPVRGRTLLDRNGYSDGHVLTEVFFNGQWTAFDPDGHCTYSHEGRPLSLLDLMTHVRADDYKVESLAGAMPMAVGHFTNREGTYDHSLWYETAMALKDHRAEFRRVMMIPMIHDGGKWCYTTPTDEDHRRAEELWADRGDLSYVPEHDYRSRLYDKDS